MPTKEQLLDGIDLAAKYMLRCAGPALRANPETGAIEEDRSEIIVGQSLGDAPVVCVVPTGGASIGKGTQVTDVKGVIYTPVLLRGGLASYRYFQPNNDHYARIVAGEETIAADISPKSFTVWSKVQFIDKEAQDQTIMELEIRRITRWGTPLASPEYEYQAEVNSYGSDYANARAVFLPDRLIESSDWTTIWKSGSSESDLGPDFPNRAAAVPGLSPFSMMIARQAALISRVPGLASLATGINRFYTRNNVTFELFEGLAGNFHIFGDDPHFIHSDEMFLPGEKTQTERPRYDWWWWPTRTGTPTSRAAYIGLHFPWREGARSIEALFYLFRFADAVPPITEANEDGIRHCYEWLKDSGFDGWGVARTGLEGSLGDSDSWGEHTGFVTVPPFPTNQVAFPLPNMANHPSPDFLRNPPLPFIGDHLLYWADHLLRFSIASGWLLRALQWQGDTARATEVKEWLIKSADVF